MPALPWLVRAKSTSDGYLTSKGHGVPTSLTAQRQPREHSSWDRNMRVNTATYMKIKFRFQSQKYFPRYIERNHAVSQDFSLHCFWESKHGNTSLLTCTVDSHPLKSSCYAEAKQVTAHPQHPLSAVTQSKAAFPPGTRLTRVGMPNPGAFSLMMRSAAQEHRPSGLISQQSWSSLELFRKVSITYIKAKTTAALVKTDSEKKKSNY